jgi:hypothetical protein
VSIQGLRGLNRAENLHAEAFQLNQEQVQDEIKIPQTELAT